MKMATTADTARRRKARTQCDGTVSPFSPYLASAMPLFSAQGVSASLFADASNFELRFVEDYDQIELPYRR